jgi:type II secretion system protein H
MTRWRIHAATGFTLLELLVVLTIVAVLSGAAVLGMGAIGQDSVLQQAQRLALVWDSVCQEAAVDARVLGLQLGSSSYAAVQPARDAVWRPTPGALYAKHTLPNGHRLRIDGIAADEQPSADPALQPQILCLPGGANAAQTVLLDVSGERRYRIEFDAKSGKHLVLAANEL